MTMNEPRTRATRAWRALSFTPVFAGLLAAARLVGRGRRSIDYFGRRGGEKDGAAR